MPKATAALKASAVEPDVRVESQDTLSLGEDRALLAVNATVEITRAGHFPAELRAARRDGCGIDRGQGGEPLDGVEDATRAGSSRCTCADAPRDSSEFAITPHRARDEVGESVGRAAAHSSAKRANSAGLFSSCRSRACGCRSRRAKASRSSIRRSRASSKRACSRFRILQTPWNLALDVEQVDPWVQVTSLQHATVGEAQVKVVANLQYQIENTGLKAFRVALPRGRGECALHRRSGRRLSRRCRMRRIARVANVGGEAAPARDRAVFLAGDVSDAGGRECCGDRAFAACRSRM